METLVVEPLVRKHKWLGEAVEVQGDQHFYEEMSLDGVQYAVSGMPCDLPVSACDGC